MQSLDGYVDGPAGNVQLGPPDPVLFRHFTDHFNGLEGTLCGRRMYQIMQYWEEDQGWDETGQAFAKAWRSKPKWVASRTLSSVGTNATLVQGDLIDFVVTLKSEHEGEISVSGPQLASVLSAAGLIDDYRLYFRPAVFGAGKPFSMGSNLPKPRLTHFEAIGAEAVCLTYVPA
jgi:dihydrofolate reductase